MLFIFLILYCLTQIIYNLKQRIVRNDPYLWDGNSIQDTALYILMNLAVSQSTRHHLKNNDVKESLSRIAKYSSTPTSSISDEEKQKDLQCLKAVRFVIFQIVVHFFCLSFRLTWKHYFLSTYVRE
jgi:hypothetical protein